MPNSSRVQRWISCALAGNQGSAHKATTFCGSIHRQHSIWGPENWYYEHVYNTKPPRRPIVKCEGVREDRWKYTRYPEIEPPYEQLFDLKGDPRETRNMRLLAIEDGSR